MHQNSIRNVAIIAHVDHGKTTLVDGLLKQSNTFAAHEKEMEQTTILDSNDLERERGVTILAKNTAVSWHDYSINIIDTPGHADFSGEVERVLTMADGCILLVDAAEGVLSQTRFVLQLALQCGLKPIVIINKVDRKDQRAHEVEQEISDLFLDLATTSEQLDFPVLYAIGVSGIAGFQTEVASDHSLTITDSTDLSPLFETIVRTLPAPDGDERKPFQMQVTTLDYDTYKGRYSIGKIADGVVKKGDKLHILRKDTVVGAKTIDHLFVYQGLGRVEVPSASTGSIIAVTGFSDATIGDTLAHPDVTTSLPTLPISEPTMKIQFWVSDSPLVGKDGQFTTARQLLSRLQTELETNVGLKLGSSESSEQMVVSGRGELHLGILIETMRREGYEFSVSKPEVVYKTIDGVQHEPWEKLTIDIPETAMGTLSTAMGERKAQFADMKHTRSGMRCEYVISTKNAIGLRSELQTKTSGMAVVHTQSLGYQPMGEERLGIPTGFIIASQAGAAKAYGLQRVQERGETFIAPGDQVYKGMIVGRTNKSTDMSMNVVKGKQLTNMRAASADATVVMAPPTHLSLEQMLTMLTDEELLEVTPRFLRLRKKDLARSW
ncbi:MAG: translational GTPase TypA [Pseudomonadales bacterium]|nr:translational GTPase TypA [Candidatus Woesebacteria bacterium]MCB9802023.1 translational GTPase TypA [Pseudomonadales bacterium]